MCFKQQVAAVLANMAANEETRHEVVENGGLPVLLKFLQCATPSSLSSQPSSATTPSGLPEKSQLDVFSNPTRPEDFAQVAAAERVLQKSAIAISRYASDDSFI